MKFYQWTTPVVVALAVAISPALAKKGGNGGGNGGGGDDGSGGTPPTVGEIVFYDGAGTYEIKPDGTNEQFALPMESGDPSNQTFAGGARWYLVVRVTEQLPRFENGEIVELIDVENVFAVHSITGEEVQVTDFVGSYYWIFNLEAKWSRDSNDLLITFMAADEIDYATVVDGQIGYDFGVDYSEYAAPGTSLLTVSVSSSDVDAAYNAAIPLEPAGRADVAAAAITPSRTEEFSVSPDLSLGTYRVVLDTYLFDLNTGATVASLGDARDVSWTASGNPVYYRWSEGIYEFDVDASQETLIASPTSNKVIDYRNPLVSPDGSSIAFSALRLLKGNNSERVVLSQNLDGSGQTELTLYSNLVRWVAD